MWQSQGPSVKTQQDNRHEVQIMLWEVIDMIDNITIEKMMLDNTRQEKTMLDDVKQEEIMLDNVR